MCDKSRIPILHEFAVMFTSLLAAQKHDSAGRNKRKCGFAQMAFPAVPAACATRGLEAANI
jgi:hypothetical protein